MVEIIEQFLIFRRYEHSAHQVAAFASHLVQDGVVDGPLIKGSLPQRAHDLAITVRLHALVVAAVSGPFIDLFIVF